MAAPPPPAQASSRMHTSEGAPEVAPPRCERISVHAVGSLAPPPHLPADTVVVGAAVVGIEGRGGDDARYDATDAVAVEGDGHGEASEAFTDDVAKGRCHAEQTDDDEDSCTSDYDIECWADHNAYSEDDEGGGLAAQHERERAAAVERQRTAAELEDEMAKQQRAAERLAAELAEQEAMREAVREEEAKREAEAATAAAKAAPLDGVMSVPAPAPALMDGSHGAPPMSCKRGLVTSTTAQHACADAHTRGRLSEDAK